MPFGPFELDPASGDLWRRGEEGTVDRLAPQPARLLAHLIARRPHLVTREEIRRLLWPDVTVEFEESLHTCVRTVRRALGDSATEPRWVETVPRRGYRFVGTVHGDDDGATRSRRPRLRAPSILLAAVLLAVLAMLVVRSAWRGPVAPLRVGVMPFEPRAVGSALSAGNPLAESIVARLSRDPRAVEVVGPTTTERYAGRPDGIETLCDDFDLDYVVNGRETTGDAGPRLLVEIVRAADGAHVWVRFLDELTPEGAGRIIAEALPGLRAGGPPPTEP